MPTSPRTGMELVARLAMVSALLCLACGEVPRSKDTALPPERLGSQALLATSAGQWSPAGALATARHFHTATLLPSGKVLVVGGYDSSSDPLASAEVYDPITGQWNPTGRLAMARHFHTATLLPSGKVLVVGGQSPRFESLASVEVYDPATGA
ncbi:MAG TPA: kelch repeat-containing protein, partial [Archangium sp.]|nr:kelch repeat-containing protein [Archangium sp.]